MNTFNRRRFIRLVLVILIAPLIGCQKEGKDLYKGMSAEQIYAQAEENVKKENYSKATKDFEALEARYPYGDYSDRAQLGLINAYYKHGDAELALSAADQFIHMNPYHSKVDYALYLKGLVYFDENYSFVYRYLPLDRSTRDPKNAMNAFDTFKELVERFPNSQYAPDARKRMVFLRNQLANYELNVVDYYIKRRAYLSAANRANYIIKHFEGTPAVPHALAALVKSYQNLKMDELANDALKTLAANYPESEAYQSIAKNQATLK